jgi:hypothetical protein
MKKLIVIGALAVISSGAFAQSSQGQGGAQAGTNGNASTTPNSTAMQPTVQDRMREGATTGNGTSMQKGENTSQPYQPSTTGHSTQAPTSNK